MPSPTVAIRLNKQRYLKSLLGELAVHLREGVHSTQTESLPAGQQGTRRQQRQHIPKSPTAVDAATQASPSSSSSSSSSLCSTVKQGILVPGSTTNRLQQSRTTTGAKKASTFRGKENRPPLPSAPPCTFPANLDSVWTQQDTGRIFADARPS